MVTSNEREDDRGSPQSSSYDTQHNGTLVRDRILQAAISLIARKGYEGTSVREIAEAANTTVPMIYYYFDSKEGLYVSLLEHGIESFLNSAPEYPPKSGFPNHSPKKADYLKRAIASVISFCQSNKTIVELIFESWFIKGCPSGVPKVEQVYWVMVERFAAILKAGIDAGEFAPVDVYLVSQHIVGIITNLMARHLIGDEKFSPEEIAGETVDFLMTGLAPRQ
ncbi:MAG TPA: TetR/AcrR family transcriptional regulator [Firmicutes bacterium]|nr:TetR/AcrR family transcriptional regulator [Bacillota bacterium]